MSLAISKKEKNESGFKSFRRELVIQRKLILAALCVILTSCSNVFLAMVDYNLKNREQTKFLVVFHKNGGDTDAIPGRRVVTLPHTTIGEGSSLPPIEPQRALYIFVGWNTKADGSGEDFDEKTEVKENIIVYAQWDPAP